MVPSDFHPVRVSIRQGLGFSRGRVFFWHQHHRHANRRYGANPTGRRRNETGWKRLRGGSVFRRILRDGPNDANAEYMGFIRRVMESNNVTYQTAELGKVDLGGGGTIAYIMALYGMNVIDCGVAVLSMHAPWEVMFAVVVDHVKNVGERCDFAIV